MRSMATKRGNGKELRFHQVFREGWGPGVRIGFGRWPSAGQAFRELPVPRPRSPAPARVFQGACRSGAGPPPASRRPRRSQSGRRFRASVRDGG